MEKLISDIALLAINKYLEEVIKNNEKCQNCQLGIRQEEKHICFFAGECVANNFKCFKER